MTLPASGVPLKLSEIADEFKAPFKVPMSELVRGGEYVPDCGSGFANENIPEEPPVAITDYYEGSVNPNPVQLFDRVLTGKVGEAAGISAYDDEGLIVEGFSGVHGPVPPAAQYVIDLKFRCSPKKNFPSVGKLWTLSGEWLSCYLQADLWMGLCQVNPAKSSLNAVLASMSNAARVRYYRSYSSRYDEGFVRIDWVGGAGRWIEEYPAYTWVYPTGSQRAHVRLSRGSDLRFDYGLWQLTPTIEIFRGNFSTPWGDPEEAHEVLGAYNNAPGYLTVVNNIPTDDGEIDLDFDYIRGYIGSDTPPW